MAPDSTASTTLLSSLLNSIHRMPPAQLPDLLQRHVAALGGDRVTLYLADLEQEHLTILPGHSAHVPGQLPIDSSDAGWAYRRVVEHISTGENGGLVLWLPLIDGIERLGVLGIEVDTLSAELLQQYRDLAKVATLVILAKDLASDTYARLMRTRQMQISAELVRAFLPPHSIGSRMATSSAIVEPAYDLGGDAFDHSVIDHTLHVSVADSMGHDMNASLSSSVTLAACRNARRSGSAELGPLVEDIDQALTATFAGQHTTGVFAHLHLDTGHLEWINAGHPTPLLLRSGEVVPGALERDPEPPLGLPEGLADSARTIHEAQLQPQDRVLVYTDGVTDAQSASGERFGTDRFADFILRAIAADEALPETLRRLRQTILAYQDGPLRDDASILLFQWHPTSSPDYFA